MADIISFEKRRGANAKKKVKGKTLCGNGHHKWRIIKDREFDSKQGKLVTRFECERCGKVKVKAL